ncbi:uncharacterized protein LY79DRAFT_659883 [Colletotrichum navitas]|uniref:Uncharacterized protein n=1 Tax=Colletotrichum navitas TaxID=681940 RepID=A0AAD8PYM0_9PEZI|nr:uncharacterized protein LY79DRAFT_659883 [Colletotrichum navitas]KAK1589943.1 hypothetical protein LY79DRAFT_659883 [Colletotrichum navitas]
MESSCRMFSWLNSPKVQRIYTSSSNPTMTQKIGLRIYDEGLLYTDDAVTRSISKLIENHVEKAGPKVLITFVPSFTNDRLIGKAFHLTVDNIFQTDAAGNTYGTMKLHAIPMT